MEEKADQNSMQRQTEAHVRTKITWIMFLCSILVIYTHTYNFEAYKISADSLGMGRATYLTETAVILLIRFAVPVFFVLSGFLFFRNVSSMAAVWKKMRARAKTVLLPYLVWCTLHYLFYVACALIPFIRNVMNSPGTGELSFSGWIGSLWTRQFYTLWFLKNLILYILCSPLIFLLFRNRGKLFNGPILLCAVYVFFLAKPTEIKLFEGLTEYLLGCCLGMNTPEIAAWKPNRKLSRAALIGIPVLTAVSNYRFDPVTKALFFVLVWLAADGLGKIAPRWWMQITFFTYVAHDLILESVEKLVYLFLPHTPGIALLDYLLAPLITETVLIGIAFILIRRVPVIWNILTGWRKPVIPSGDDHSRQTGTD